VQSRTQKECLPAPTIDAAVSQQTLAFAQIFEMSTPQKLTQLFQLLELNVHVEDNTSSADSDDLTIR
jgi:hypothetical protein